MFLDKINLQNSKEINTLFEFLLEKVIMPICKGESSDRPYIRFLELIRNKMEQKGLEGVNEDVQIAMLKNFLPQIVYFNEEKY